ncbi:MAG: FAD-dependent oxidoreductase [Pseudohongiella sp.]|nr:FAD-dependent oxidoreductase [Pseudohongiella sp.]
MTLSTVDSMMPAPASPLVLVGAGHAHLVMMRLWLQQGWRPPAGTVLLSSGAQAWYSGMMPGLIAGRFDLKDCAIELLPLCQQLGIILETALVTALDSRHQHLTLDNGKQLQYLLLSINSGSQPLGPTQLDGSVSVLPAKPFPDFIRHWQHWHDQAPARMMVLGGGAAAFELALALKKQFPASELSLACSGELLQSHGPRLRSLALHWLGQAGIRVFQNSRVDRINNKRVFAGDQILQSIDALIVATGASALPWYAQSGLVCDSHGFVGVDRFLRSSHPQVFAAGDAASSRGSVRSGVFSVRHGPVLAHNLRAAILGQELQAYRPQKNALALLATGDGGAVMSYGKLALGSRLTAPLLGRWKDHLDLSFMRHHRTGG